MSSSRHQSHPRLAGAVRSSTWTSTLLAGGVALYATNEFLTASLLPSAITDIGGERLFAWVTTLYLVGSVVAATMVNAALLRVGPRRHICRGWPCSGSAAWCVRWLPTWLCCWWAARCRGGRGTCWPVWATR